MLIGSISSGSIVLNLVVKNCNFIQHGLIVRKKKRRDFQNIKLHQLPAIAIIYFSISVFLLLAWATALKINVAVFANGVYQTFMFLNQNLICCE
jgi:hypothetical protein